MTERQLGFGKISGADREGATQINEASSESVINKKPLGSSFSSGLDEAGGIYSSPGKGCLVITLTFMVLWFFLVFFRNCLRLPDDMYSVMKMTCKL